MRQLSTRTIGSVDSFVEGKAMYSMFDGYRHIYVCVYRIEHGILSLFFVFDTFLPCSRQGSRRLPKAFGTIHVGYAIGLRYCHRGAIFVCTAEGARVYWQRLAGWMCLAHGNTVIEEDG